MNKKLLVIIILLLPIAVISFFYKEANFSLSKDKPTQIISVKLRLSSNNKIVEIPLEEYVIGVVAAEMPAEFKEEALKAQAIASRTYAYSKLENILTDNTSNQVYIDTETMKEKWQNKYEEYYKKIRDCVKATENLVVTYNKEPIITYYFAISNGKTENSELVFNEAKPYLKSVESKWDNEEIKNYKVDTRFSKKEFCEKLSIECSKLSIEILKKSDANRVLTLKINNKEYKGTEIRTKLSLRSTDFDIKVTEEYVYISTKGYGHGVGMSQYGANGMAKEGASYTDILKHYYRNIEIINLNNV